MMGEGKGTKTNGNNGNKSALFYFSYFHLLTPMLAFSDAPILWACLRRPYSRPGYIQRHLSSFPQPISNTFTHSAPYPERTHTCGSLTARDAGSRVIMTGWLLHERKGKHMSFYPLKDSYGTTQLIVNHDDVPGLSALASLPLESTVLIEGTVLLRPPTARRPVSDYPRKGVS